MMQHSDGAVAVVGFGYWGRNLVRNLHELGALAAVCDSDESRRRELEEQYPGVPFLRDVKEVLSRSDVQAVAIATPAVTHVDIARRALERGKDVFVEKPLAMTVPQGEELGQLAQKNERVLMVGHLLLYHPAVLRLKALIDAGELGKALYVYSNRLNAGRIRTEENILWSFAPHDISVMLYLLGEMPDRVHACGATYLNEGVADVTLSDFEFPSGVRGHIFLSWLHPFKEQRLVVVGSEQMAVFEDTRAEKLMLYPHRVTWVNRVPTIVKAEGQVVDLPDAEEPLRAECTHFLECIRDRTVPRTDAQEGVRVLRVLSACQRAMHGDTAGNPTAQASQAAQRKGVFVHESSCVDQPVEIGEGTKIWHFSHVMKGARIGPNCVIGQNVNISGNAALGSNVKVQNNVSVYDYVTLEDDVFCGPSCVFTNVHNPRSHIPRKDEYRRTLVRQGATIGANATVVCGHTIGRYAFVGAGAVVTRDVPDHALVYGNPARVLGWMCVCGTKLSFDRADGVDSAICRACGGHYTREGAQVKEVPLAALNGKRP